MKPLTSCCCFDLRTGGLIIGWLCIIDCAFNILQVIMDVSMSEQLHIEDVAINGAWIVVFASLLVVEVFWIVGIQKNKERMMMPSLVLSIVGCILMGITYAIVLILSFAAFVAVFSTPDRKGESEVDYLIIIMLVVSVIKAFLAVLIAYFVSVKYYLYKEIKERNRSPSNIISAAETGLAYNMFFNNPNSDQIQTDANNTKMIKNESDIVSN